MKIISLASIILTISTTILTAGVCDYRPSSWVGTTGAIVGTGAAGATAAAGIGLKSAGIYAITNGTTGAAMLGTTTVGASAAGTGGIIAGTSGLLGTVGSILLAPEVIIGAAVVGVVGGVYEGGCYLAE